MEAAGYGFHHQSDDGKYLIMGNGTRAYIRIHYNCVGAIEIPDLIPLPAPEVSVNTRKGVVVNYAPSTIAG